MINVSRKIEKVIVDPIRSNDATKRIIVISVFNDLDRKSINKRFIKTLLVRKYYIIKKGKNVVKLRSTV